MPNDNIINRLDERTHTIQEDTRYLRNRMDEICKQPIECSKRFVSYKALGLILASIGGVIGLLKLICTSEAMAAILAIL